MIGAVDCQMCGEGQHPGARPCEDCRPVLDAEVDRLSREPWRTRLVLVIEDGGVRRHYEDHA